MSDGKGFRGWVVVGGLLSVYLALIGIYTLSFGVFLPSITGELGWSREMISGAYLLHSVLFCLLGPVAGLSITRLGARANLVMGNLLVALGLLGMAFIAEPWHIYLTYGVLGGAGISLGGMITCTTVVNQWFIRRRSLVIAIVLSAGGIGGLAFPPLMAWLILGGGWRPALMIMAGAYALLAVLIPGILVRGRPGDVGQLPDGRAEGGREAGAGSSPSSAYQTPVDWEPAQTMRQGTTWLIILMSILILFVSTIITVHQVAYLEDSGYSKMVAATALGLIPGMSVIGRLAIGALALRFKIRYLILAFFALRVISFVILINADSLPLIYLYAALYGIGFGGLVSAYPLIMSAYYGRSKYHRIVGWTLPFTALGATGAVVAGRLYDVTGGYQLVFIIAIAISVLGGICAIMARPPKLPVPGAGVK
ncbi:MAG: MFS transporter [Chloroflexota bacterium]